MYKSYSTSGYTPLPSAGTPSSSDIMAALAAQMTPQPKAAWWQRLLAIPFAVGGLPTAASKSFKEAKKKKGKGARVASYLGGLIGNYAQGLGAGVNTAFSGAPLQPFVSGSQWLSELGWNPKTGAGKFARGAAGLGMEVFSDPTTAVSFGAAGLGKKAASEIVEKSMVAAGKKAASTIAQETAEQFAKDLAERGAAIALEGGVRARMPVKFLSYASELSKGYKPIKALELGYPGMKAVRASENPLVVGAAEAVVNPVAPLFRTGGRLAKAAAPEQVASIQKGLAHTFSPERFGAIIGHRELPGVLGRIGRAETGATQIALGENKELLDTIKTITKDFTPDEMGQFTKYLETNEAVPRKMLTYAQQVAEEYRPKIRDLQEKLLARRLIKVLPELSDTQISRLAREVNAVPWTYVGKGRGRNIRGVFAVGDTISWDIDSVRNQVARVLASMKSHVGERGDVRLGKILDEAAQEVLAAKGDLYATLGLLENPKDIYATLSHEYAHGLWAKTQGRDVSDIFKKPIQNYGKTIEKAQRDAMFREAGSSAYQTLGERLGIRGDTARQALKVSDDVGRAVEDALSTPSTATNTIRNFVNQFISAIRYGVVNDAGELLGLLKSRFTNADDVLKDLTIGLGMTDTEASRLKAVRIVFDKTKEYLEDYMKEGQRVAKTRGLIEELVSAARKSKTPDQFLQGIEKRGGLPTEIADTKTLEEIFNVAHPKLNREQNAELLRRIIRDQRDFEHSISSRLHGLGVGEEGFRNPSVEAIGRQELSKIFSSTPQGVYREALDLYDKIANQLPSREGVLVKGQEGVRGIIPKRISKLAVATRQAFDDITSKVKLDAQHKGMFSKLMAAYTGQNPEFANDALKVAQFYQFMEDITGRSAQIVTQGRAGPIVNMNEVFANLYSIAITNPERITPSIRKVINAIDDGLRRPEFFPKLTYVRHDVKGFNKLFILNKFGKATSGVILSNPTAVREIADQGYVSAKTINEIINSSAGHLGTSYRKATKILSDIGESRVYPTLADGMAAGVVYNMDPASVVFESLSRGERAVAVYDATQKLIKYTGEDGRRAFFTAEEVKEMFKGDVPATMKKIDFAGSKMSLYADKDVADLAKYYMNKMILPEETTKLLKGWDTMLSWWKKSVTGLGPGFIGYNIRNMFGDMFNMMMDGFRLFSPEGLNEMKRAYNIVRFDQMARFGGGARLAEEKFGSETAKLWQQMWRDGVLNTQGQWLEEVGKISGEKPGVLQKVGNIWEQIATMKGATRGRENMFRVAHYLDSLSRTGSRDEAIAAVKRALFNYDELTDVERNVFRRVIPFYTWARKNFEFHMTNFMLHPNKYYVVRHITDSLKGTGGMTDEDWAALPDWMKAGVAIGLTKKSGEATVLTQLGLPTESVQTLLSESPLSVLRQVLGMTAPPIRMTAELATGQNLFTKKPIIQETYGGRYEKFPGFMKTLLGYREQETWGKKGKYTKQTVDPYSAYLLANTPVLGSLSTQYKRATETAEEPINIISLLSGGRVYTRNIEQEKEARQREALQRLYELLARKGMASQYTNYSVPVSMREKLVSGQ